MKLSEGLRRGMELKQKLLHPYCAAVIVAAGTSSRMGGTNKILTILENLPVICRTLAAFNNHPAIDEIIVVTRPDVIERMSRVCVAYEKVHIVVSGGASRTESVQKGLAAVSEGTQLVAVHIIKCLLFAALVAEISSNTSMWTRVSDAPKFGRTSDALSKLFFHLNISLIKHSASSSST